MLLSLKFGFIVDVTVWHKNNTIDVKCIFTEPEKIDHS